HLNFILPFQVRVGAIQFSNTPRLEFSLDAYFTKHEIKDQLKKIVFKGGRTETGLALKHILQQGFHGGRNSLVPQILIILTDGRSQDNVSTLAQKIKERGIAVFAIGVNFPSFSSHTINTDSEFLPHAPGCRAESHACERRTLERVKELVGNYFCWKGSRSSNIVRTSLCPFYNWRNIFIKYPSTCYRTICSDPCDSHPCQNRGTCIQQGLEDYHCVCPVGFGGDSDCGMLFYFRDWNLVFNVLFCLFCSTAPNINLECSVDLLFLVDSSSSTTLESFLYFKAFLKRFLHVVWNTETLGNVALARYSNDVKMIAQIGDYRDMLSLVNFIDSMEFNGGNTLTGKALQFITHHGFKRAPVFVDVPEDLPHVVVLLTDSKAEDSVVEAAKFSRKQGISIIAIGSEFLRRELVEITGNPKQTIIYSTTQDLVNKITELQRKICSIDSQGCLSQPLDLVFALDSSASAGRFNFAQMKNFVSSLSSQFGINRDVTQVSLVVFGKGPQTVFGLDTHVTSSALQEAIKQAPFMGGSASVGSALLHIHDDVTVVQKGARPGVKKVVVLFTSGAGVDDAVVPAQQLRSNDVSLLIIVTERVQIDLLLRIAGTSNSLVRISSYEDLRHNEDFIIEKLCDGKVLAGYFASCDSSIQFHMWELLQTQKDVFTDFHLPHVQQKPEAKMPVNICKPNPCMNYGICIPKNGNYWCQCQGWEGPHCENRIQSSDTSQSWKHYAMIHTHRN
ncbi:von Willebrand factor A domain-containing protein 2, partial [Ophiophagus hannah]